MWMERNSYRFMGAMFTACCALACSSVDESKEQVATAQEDLGLSNFARATLRDATGAIAGNVLFTKVSSTDVVVAVSAQLPASAGTDGIHGFHVHANDNPANGDGCVAPDFVSADGHYNPGGATHGNHAGDMPAIFFTESNKGAMSFLDDRFLPNDVRGRAVIVHAAPDNYGNVPVGAAANQYTPNAADATTLTQTTGNAGARILCGVIQ